MLVVMACRGRDEAAARQANAAAARGDLVTAEHDAAQAALASPRNARLAALHGNLLWQLGQPREASQEWQRAAEVDPAQVLARRGLATVGLAAGDAGPGLESEDALVRARALLLRGHPGDAQAAVDALGVAPGSSEARYVRGCALTATSKYSEAQQVFDDLHEQAPLLAAFGLARLAAARGQAGEALHQLAAARAAAGARWSADAVRTDPAFAFLADSGDFKALILSPP